LFFESIEVENFLSFESGRFDVSNGLILVSGKNGAGKSSLFVDSICFCLTGVTTKGSRGDSVINWSKGNDCKVSVTFHDNDNIYRVDRYRGHSGVDKAGVPFGNRLIYSRNGEDIEKSSIAATQGALLEEINVDIDLLKCTILLSQDNKFNFVDSTDKQQKEILSKIRRVDFDNKMLAVKEGISNISNSLSSVRRKIDVLNSHIVSRESIIDLKMKSDNFETNKEIRIQEIEHKIDSLRTAEFDSHGMTDMTESLERVAVAKRRFEKIKDSISKINGMIWTIDKSIKENDKSGVCQACGADIDEKKVGDILFSLRSKRDLLIEKKNDLVEKSSKAESDLEIAAAEKDSIVERNRRHEDCVRRAEYNRKEVVRLTSDIDSIKNSDNVYKTQIKEMLKKQSQIKLKISEMESECEKLESDLPYYNFWLRAFGDKGIKSFIFDSICGRLTTKANRFVNFLTNGGISISFDTQSKLKSGDIREKFECRITKDGRNVSYCEYSGGEKRRVSLAVDMALCEIMTEFYGTKFNFLVLDEQSNYIDVEGKIEYFKLAKELSKDKCVVVIDHDSLLQSKFDRTITITNEGGISKIG